MSNKIFLLMLILLVVPNVLAQKNTIKLLAVNDATNNGTIVDLDLDIVDGSGRVFIETQPLSQIDTQISLRIAKTIACKTSEKYCLDKDFFYSLSTSSPVVAGPSAGAAMTLLTMAALEDQRLDPNIVITGTINSGGVIGTVGGVKEKIKAAANSGIKTVLIPKGEKNSTELIEYGRNLSINVIDVSDIEEAYAILTNQKIPEFEPAINEDYKRIMKKINEEMCARTNKLKTEAEKYEDNSTLKEKAFNLSNEGAGLFKNEKYYSSASRCFGANVYLREFLLKKTNVTAIEIINGINLVNGYLTNTEKMLNSTKITNLGGLETAMIMRERIYDARMNIEEMNSTDPYRALSYAIERAMSADSWALFMKFPGKSIDESKLKESCTMKIMEVQELYNYASIYMPYLIEDIKKEFDDAKQYLKTEDYALCLFKASKSEAEIDVTLSAIYTNTDNVDSLVQKKIDAAGNAITKQIQKGNFPILGYSYYEYAKVLNSTDKYSALLYAEYGIELSNLDIYFPTKKPVSIRINRNALITLILGIIIGALLFIKRQYRRKRIVFRRRH